jgi:translation initiation factor 1
VSHTWLTFLRIADPFAEADEDTGETKQSQNYIHIRIQRKLLPLLLAILLEGSTRRLYDATTDKENTDIKTIERNGRKTLTTVQGLPKKFDQKKILKVIKKKFGTVPLPLAR